MVYGKIQEGKRGKRMAKKIKSAIFYFDFKRLRLNKSFKDRLEISKELMNYVCYISDQSGVKATNMFSVINSRYLAEDLAYTDVYDAEFNAGFKAKLERCDVVILVDGLNEASEIPEKLKQVITEQFKPIITFSKMFGQDNCGSVVQRLFKLREGIEDRKFGREAMCRGARQK